MTNIHNFSLIQGKCILPKPVYGEGMKQIDGVLTNVPTVEVHIATPTKVIHAGSLTPGIDVSGEYIKAVSNVTKRVSKWMLEKNARSWLSMEAGLS